MQVWVAYHPRDGSLLVEADNENDLLRQLALYGIDEDAVDIRIVTT